MCLIYCIQAADSLPNHKTFCAGCPIVRLISDLASIYITLKHLLNIIILWTCYLSMAYQ